MDRKTNSLITKPKRFAWGLGLDTNGLQWLLIVLLIYSKVIHSCFLFFLFSMIIRRISHFLKRSVSHLDKHKTAGTSVIVSYYDRARFLSTCMIRCTVWVRCLRTEHWTWEALPRRSPMCLVRPSFFSNLSLHFTLSELERSPKDNIFSRLHCYYCCYGYVSCIPWISPIPRVIGKRVIDNQLDIMYLTFRVTAVFQPHNSQLSKHTLFVSPIWHKPVVKSECSSVTCRQSWFHTQSRFSQQKSYKLPQILSEVFKFKKYIR